MATAPPAPMTAAASAAPQGPPPALPSPAAELAAITLTSKIPDFWTDQPRVWFIRTEAMLAPQKLSDDARYDIVVSKLSKEAIQQVTDILTQPPPVKKYEALKTRLLRIYEESAIRQIQKLISEMELGDQKPSHLLRRMRELAKNKVPDDTLRIMWQGHLPNTVRAVLAVSETKELDRLSTIADNVFENTCAVQVNEVSQPTTNRDTDIILAEIAKLTLKVAELESAQSKYQRPARWNNHRSRSSSRYPSRNSSRTRPSPGSPDWLCFYHRRFRARAKKCQEPCSWKAPRQEN